MMRQEQGAIHLEVLSAIRGRIRLQMERPVRFEAKTNQIYRMKKILNPT